jgi:hypothetical protein
MRKFFVVLFVAILTMFAAGNAFAWTWSGYENADFGGIKTYDQIDLVWKSGDTLSNPTFTGLSGDWKNWDGNTSTVAAAFGSATSGNTFYTLNFTGSNQTSTIFYQISLDSVVQGRGIFTLGSGSIVSGSIFTGTDAEWKALGGSSPVVTPEPVSSVLFLTGGAALFLRRRKKGSRFWK